jgi:hypothetical protein
MHHQGKDAHKVLASEAGMALGVGLDKTSDTLQMHLLPVLASEAGMAWSGGWGVGGRETSDQIQMHFLLTDSFCWNVCPLFCDTGDSGPGLRRVLRWLGTEEFSLLLSTRTATSRWTQLLLGGK